MNVLHAQRKTVSHVESTHGFPRRQRRQLIKGRTPPPDDTHQEAAYLKMLGEKQKPVRIKLMGGEVVRGWIEYYDRRMVRLTREGAPNLFIFKHEIAYIAEEHDPQAAPRRAPLLAMAIPRTTRNEPLPSRFGSDCARGRHAC